MITPVITSQKCTADLPGNLAKFRHPVFGHCFAKYVCIYIYSIVYIYISYINLFNPFLMLDSEIDSGGDLTPGISLCVSFQTFARWIKGQEWPCIGVTVAIK